MATLAGIWPWLMAAPSEAIAAHPAVAAMAAAITVARLLAAAGIAGAATAGAATTAAGMRAIEDVLSGMRADNVCVLAFLRSALGRPQLWSGLKSGEPLSLGSP